MNNDERSMTIEDIFKSKFIKYFISNMNSDLGLYEILIKIATKYDMNSDDVHLILNSRFNEISYHIMIRSNKL
jgi:hypothetical protein